MIGEQMLYMLDENKNIISINDMDLWVKFMQDPIRIIEKTMVGNIEISTVFLGTDGFFQNPPLLFETAIFNSDFKEVSRYATIQEAIKGHNKMVRLVKKKMR